MAKRGTGNKGAAARGGLKKKARQYKVEVYALYFACRHPDTPWYAKGFTALVVAYALSPVDLIPDFIPILGYLDDLILIPAGIWLAIRMIPDEIMQESRVQARELADRPRSWLGILLVVTIWLLLIALLAYLIRH